MNQQQQNTPQKRSDTTRYPSCYDLNKQHIHIHPPTSLFQCNTYLGMTLDVSRTYNSNNLIKPHYNTPSRTDTPSVTCTKPTNHWVNLPARGCRAIHQGFALPYCPRPDSPKSHNVTQFGHIACHNASITHAHWHSHMTRSPPTSCYPNHPLSITECFLCMESPALWRIFRNQCCLHWQAWCDTPPFCLFICGEVYFSNIKG